jgi:hypothetical protein
MLFGIGIFLLVFAVLMLAFELRSSYVSHGGEIGQVPVLSGAVQVPLLAITGLWLIGSERPAYALSWWAYFLIGVALFVMVGWLIVKVGNLGKRKHSNGT